MRLIIFTIVLTLITIGYSDSSANPRKSIEISQNTIESLMIGLNSENLGLRSSCVYMIGELRLSQAEIPLLRMLREDENEELRIAAALALYKICSPIAIHAVKQSIRFDESQRVSKHCADFYGEYLKNKLIDEDKGDDSLKVAEK